VKYLTEYAKIHFLKKASKVEVAIYSGSRGKDGFVTLFFISNNKPKLVAKVARTSTALENLRAEYINLKHVSRLLQGSPLETTIENPLDLVVLNGLGILFKEYKDGISGIQYLHSLFLKKRRMERFLYLSTDWLINFTKQTQESHINSPDVKQRVIQELVHGKALPNYARVFIDENSFFLAPTHGEFLPSNILIDQRTKRVKGVFDFERFRMDGMPISDLTGLIVTSGMLLFGLDEAAINSMFLRNGWFVKLYTNCVKKFCLEFSIDIHAFREIMPLYSDRAIELCQKWNMDEKLLQFHRRLRTFIIEKKNDIFII